ncbi:MAG: metalloregulator ArsR/SmtB family transcription factor [Pseudomonadota bacterium]
MEIDDAVVAFSALAQPTRLAILKRLIAAGPGGETAGGLADGVGAPAPTISFHLKELVRAGLIQARRNGRRRIYAADYGGVRDLIDYLLADCCGGDRRLCGPYVILKETA